MKKILACLLCLLLLTGCALGESVYVPTGDALFQDTTTVPRQEDPSYTEQRLTLSFDPTGTLNPYTDSDPSNRVLFSLMYQGLFSVDMDYTVSPVLCSKYSVSKDMKSYTFYLEPATFPDGSVITAEDVIASLEAARSGTVYGGRFGYINTISATEDGAVRIELKTPYENLPVLLDVPIVKAAEVGAQWPDGTGPYYRSDSLSGTRLVRRTDWWCKASLAATASAISLLEADSEFGLK